MRKKVLFISCLFCFTVGLVGCGTKETTTLNCVVDQQKYEMKFVGSDLQHFSGDLALEDEIQTKFITKNKDHDTMVSEIENYIVELGGSCEKTKKE